MACKEVKAARFRQLQRMIDLLEQAIGALLTDDQTCFKDDDEACLEGDPGPAYHTEAMRLGDTLNSACDEAVKLLLEQSQ